MAGIVVLYHFLFSSFKHINYVFKTGELKVIQDNDSCHIKRKIYLLRSWTFARQRLVLASKKLIFNSQ